jgi:hypothetical protein
MGRRFGSLLLTLSAAGFPLTQLTIRRPGRRGAVDDDALEQAPAERSGPRETMRRAAVGTLFGLHTLRFRIYLQPGQGLHPPDRPAVAMGAQGSLGPASGATARPAGLA